MMPTSFIQTLTASTWEKACQPQWLSKGPECPYGTVEGPPMGVYTWPREDARSWIHYVAMFYSIVPFILAVGLPVVFLFTQGLRELLAIAFFWMHKGFMMGFKHMAAQRRPVGTCLSSCGMPSGHSMVAAAFFAWIVFEVGTARSIERARKAAYIAAAGMFFAPVAWSRVVLNDHSWAQVAVGTVSGIAYAAVWDLFLHLRVSRRILEIIPSKLSILRANYPGDLAEEESPLPNFKGPATKKK